MTGPQKYSVKGGEALFGAALLYSFSAVLIRELGTMWGDKAQVAARFVPVFIFLVGYSLISKKKRSIPRAKLKYGIALSASFASVVLFFTAAVQHTTIANTLFTFFATNMIASFLFGTFLLREKVTIAKIVAIIFALAGLSVYAQAILTLNRGILFAVVAGLCDGGSNVFRKKLGGVDRVAVNRLQYGAGTIITAGVSLISGEQILRKVSPEAIILTLLFACAMLMATSLLLYGYQHFDVNIGTVILSSEIIFGALLGLLFYREVPALHETIGGALILTGAVVSSLNFDWPQRHSKP